MSESRTTILDADQAYEVWASSYDATPNPLLMLEERCLSSVFCDIFEKDVVDLGCGTGRWLTRLEPLHPASLTGVDSSAAMLAEAKGKCLPSTRLIHAGCIATPLQDDQADLVLASFVVSYVENLEKFAQEASRLLRPGGTLIVSDMHPDAASYGWRRTFHASAGTFEIATRHYSLDDLTSVISDAGFALEELAEPSFGEEEAEIFRRAGKFDAFLRVQSLPVIYWARFSATANRQR
jgi:ubiquinone/menaquinone biosynthesis C-methylase UbiE